MESQTPASALLRQHTDILMLAERLFNIADVMTTTTDPEAATWGDVGKNSMVAEMATKMLAELDEIGE